MRDLPQQAAVLRRAVQDFERDDRVTGLVLSGSLAFGERDRWSDVDLYIVADEQFDAVFEERQHAAAGVGQPVAEFTVLGQSSDHIVLYSDLVKIDLMYYRARDVQPHRKWANALVLKDARGSLNDVQERSRALRVAPLPDDELLRLDQQFWVWTWYTFGKIMRGEQLGSASRSARDPVGGDRPMTRGTGGWRRSWQTSVTRLRVLSPPLMLPASTTRSSTRSSSTRPLARRCLPVEGCHPTWLPRLSSRPP